MITRLMDRFPFPYALIVGKVLPRSLSERAPDSQKTACTGAMASTGGGAGGGGNDPAEGPAPEMPEVQASTEGDDMDGERAPSAARDKQKQI